MTPTRTLLNEDSSKPHPLLLHPHLRTPLGRETWIPGAQQTPEVPAEWELDHHHQGTGMEITIWATDSNHKMLCLLWQVTWSRNLATKVTHKKPTRTANRMVWVTIGGTQTTPTVNATPLTTDHHYPITTRIHAPIGDEISIFFFDRNFTSSPSHFIYRYKKNVNQFLNGFNSVSVTIFMENGHCY